MIRTISFLFLAILVQGCSSNYTNNNFESNTPNQGYISDVSLEKLAIYKHDLPYQFNRHHPFYEFSRMGVFIENDKSESVVFGWHNEVPIPRKPDMWVKLKNTGILCIQNNTEEFCTRNAVYNVNTVSNIEDEKSYKIKATNKNKRKDDCVYKDGKRECYQYYGDGSIVIKNTKSF